jgi:hypothetical protein
MKLSESRKNVRRIRSTALRQDFEAMIDAIEKVIEADRELAGRRVTALIGFAVALKRTLPRTTRFSIVKALFADDVKGELPHQWERKEGFECDKQDDWSKPNQDSTCYRDTWTGSCASG